MKLSSEYLAGFFDGEGSVYPGESKGYRSLHCSLANNHKPLLDLVQESFGGCVSHASGENCWQWQAGGADTIFSFLTYIVSHLKIKQREAAVALAICQTTHNQGERYTDQDLLLRERLFLMLEEAAEQRKRPFLLAESQKGG